jgi:beta-glucosidase
LPLWVADLGGFENPDIAAWMGNYAKVVGESLGSLIGVACTVNEPNIVALMGYLIGAFPPAQSDWERFSTSTPRCAPATSPCVMPFAQLPVTIPLGCPSP